MLAINTIFKIIGYLFKEQKLRVNLRLILIAGSVLFAKACTTAAPLIYGKVIDLIANREEQLSIIALGLIGGYGLVQFFSFSFERIHDITLARLSKRTSRLLSLDVFSRLHDLSHDFHFSNSAGSLSQSIQQGIRGVNNLFLSLFFGFFPLVLEIILIAFTILFSLNLFYMVALLLITVLYFLPAVYITNYRLLTLREMNKEETKINSLTVESLTNFELIKCFNKKEYELSRLDKHWNKLEDLNVRSTIQLSSLRLIQKGLFCLLLTGLLGFLYHQSRSGYLTVGQVVMLMTYFVQIFQPIEILAYEQDRIRHALVDTEAIFKILNSLPIIKDKLNARALKVQQGEIRFENVKFHYKHNFPLLKDISFTIPPLKTVALIGKTGSGKTTISRLLLRLYDVTEGSIKIDDQDLRDITQESLRELIAIVPQDITLFNNTIFYNIAYPKHNATPEEVQNVAHQAHLHDFICSLPQGYETIIGERGLKLSGGERQRLALARALLLRPRILIFDEATSSLDAFTEKIIQDNINKLHHHCTIIIIAHRLATVINADKIFVLDDGKIVEQGTHDELINQDNFYASLTKVHLMKY